MHILRTVIKYILYFLLSVILLLCVYLLSERILSRVPAQKHHYISSKSNITLYIQSNGVHTDIILPVINEQIDWRKYFPTTNNLIKDTTYEYVGIGWGDKGFYLNTPQWKDLKISTALIAATGIGSTALHVTYYKNILPNTLTYEYKIDKDQYNAIIHYITSSIEKDENGNTQPISTNAQYTQTDAFYESKGAYSIFFTCNTWTNKALKQAGMPAGKWLVFDTGILYHYKKAAQMN